MSSGSHQTVRSVIEHGEPDTQSALDALRRPRHPPKFEAAIKYEVDVFLGDASADAKPEFLSLVVP